MSSKYETSDGVFLRQIFCLVSLTYGGPPIALYSGAMIIAILREEQLNSYASVIMFCARHSICFGAPNVINQRGIMHVNIQERIQYQHDTLSLQRSC
jgi:hypothetical protein